MSGQICQIHLKQYQLDCHIGVSELERAKISRLQMDVTLWFKTSATQSDQLQDSVDYQSLAHAIHQQTHGQQYQLLERLAQVISDVCYTFKAVERVSIDLYKHQILEQCAKVGVTLETQRS